MVLWLRDSLILSNYVSAVISQTADNDSNSVFDSGIVSVLGINVLEIDGVSVNNNINLLSFVILSVSDTIG